VIRPDGLRFGSDPVGPCPGPHSTARRAAAAFVLAVAMPAPPLLAITVGLREHEALPVFYASVAVLLAAAVGLGSTAVPGQNRGWVVERIGVTALVAWAAGLDVAILERAFVTAHADAEVASFAIAGAVYLVGSTWAFTDVKHFDWNWTMTSVATSAVWLAVLAAA
jgi:hypothetical protein